MPVFVANPIPKPHPNTRAVFETRVAPFMAGTGAGRGDTSIVCGSCGQLLVDSIAGAVFDIVVHCPSCGRYVGIGAAVTKAGIS